MGIYNFKSAILMFMSFGLLSLSCSTDNEDDGIFQNGAKAKVSLKAKGTYNNGPSAKGLSQPTLKANLEISSFLVNIGEIELEFDDDSWDDDDYFGFDDEIELKGPFELDLVQNEFTFAVVNLPRARYEELEFEFKKSRDASSELYGKTVLVRGNLDGVPFEFWHHFEEDLEIDYEDRNRDIIVSGNNDEITINFNLNGMLSNIDLSAATDGNGDGFIEISPVDGDGNRALANRMRERIKDFIDLLDD